MEILQQFIFLIALATSIFLFSKQVKKIRRNILLGQPEVLNDNPVKRWKNVFLLALGQKKMFKNPLVAVLHLFIYGGFVIINLEMMEIIIDGLAGSHRIFATVIPSIYTLLINTFELLAFTVIVGCIIFFVRRNQLNIARLKSVDLKGWPAKDANLILIIEVVLMCLFLTMNAADVRLQSKGIEQYAVHQTGPFLISSFIAPLLSNLTTTGLIAVERTCWWLHILGVFAFLNYLPWSKHLHIILAFPNAFYGRLTPQGKFTNMPIVQQEVLYAFQPELAPTTTESTSQLKFGAKDVQDLSWKNIMDAYSCTECGRCSSACPANLTGKLLSPRKIMMDTRDRAEEVGNNIDKNGSYVDDNKSLLYDFISEEELRACTTCNACVEACPVSINPLDIIIQMRRYLVMEKSSAPQEWTMMFGNVENNFAPWKFSQEQRADWIDEG